MPAPDPDCLACKEAGWCNCDVWDVHMCPGVDIDNYEDGCPLWGKEIPESVDGASIDEKAKWYICLPKGAI